MPTIINGSTGVSLVQDSTITSAKIVDGSIAAADLALEASSLGVGQTRTDVTASRAAATNYYNNTGKPIEVILTSVTDDYFSINGLQVARLTAGAARNSCSFVVKPGEFYSFGGAAFLWVELR
jgi:hypothetical protein